MVNTAMEEVIEAKDFFNSVFKKEDSTMEDRYEACMAL